MKPKIAATLEYQVADYHPQQSGALSLVGRVQILLSLVESFRALLCQLSNAIKNQLVASKAHYLGL